MPEVIRKDDVPVGFKTYRRNMAWVIELLDAGGRPMGVVTSGVFNIKYFESRRQAQSEALARGLIAREKLVP